MVFINYGPNISYWCDVIIVTALNRNNITKIFFMTHSRSLYNSWSYTIETGFLKICLKQTPILPIKIGVVQANISIIFKIDMVQTSIYFSITSNAT